jgi:rhodanese-related sulfurtransferase
MGCREVRIGRDDVRELLARGEPLVLVDVRGSAAWDASFEQLPGALRVPLAQAEEALATLPRGRMVVVYCSDPGEATSARVARLLRDGGFDAYALTGGFDEWLEAGAPVEPKGGAALAPTA